MPETDAVRAATRLVPTLDAAGPTAGPPSVSPPAIPRTTPEAPIVDGVDRASGPARGVRPMPEREAFQGAARAIANGSTAGLFTWLRANPSALACLGRISADGVEQGIRRELASMRPEGFLHPLNTASNVRQAAAAAGEVASAIRNIGCEHVRQEARGIVNLRIVELARVRGNIDRLLPQLVAAQPGTPLGRMAGMLGVRGADGDAERARAAIDQATQGLQRLRADLEGQTWELGDFEHATLRALDRMGLAPAGFESITQDQIHGHHHDGVDAHRALFAVEGAHAAIEGAALLLEGGIAFPPFAIAAIGIGLAIYIHHGVEQIADDRRALGRALGL